MSKYSAIDELLANDPIPDYSAIDEMLANDPIGSEPGIDPKPDPELDTSALDEVMSTRTPAPTATTPKGNLPPLSVSKPSPVNQWFNDTSTEPYIQQTEQTPFSEGLASSAKTLSNIPKGFASAVNLTPQMYGNAMQSIAANIEFDRIDPESMLYKYQQENPENFLFKKYTDEEKYGLNKVPEPTMNILGVLDPLRDFAKDRGWHKSLNAAGKKFNKANKDYVKSIGLDKATGNAPIDKFLFNLGSAGTSFLASVGTAIFLGPAAPAISFGVAQKISLLAEAMNVPIEDFTADFSTISNDGPRIVRNEDGTPLTVGEQIPPDKRYPVLTPKQRYDEAAKRSTIGGIAEYAWEHLGLHFFLKRYGGFYKNMAIKSLENGMQEGSQTSSENVVASWRNAKWNDGTGESIAIGMILGWVGSGAFDAMQEDKIKRLITEKTGLSKPTVKRITKKMMNDFRREMNRDFNDYVKDDLEATLKDMRESTDPVDFESKWNDYKQAELGGEKGQERSIDAFGKGELETAGPNPTVKPLKAPTNLRSSIAIEVMNEVITLMGGDQTRVQDMHEGYRDMIIDEVSQMVDEGESNDTIKEYLTQRFTPDYTKGEVWVKSQPQGHATDSTIKIWDAVGRRYVTVHEYTQNLKQMNIQLRKMGLPEIAPESVEVNREMIKGQAPGIAEEVRQNIIKDYDNVNVTDVTQDEQGKSEELVDFRGDEVVDTEKIAAEAQEEKANNEIVKRFKASKEKIQAIRNAIKYLPKALQDFIKSKIDITDKYVVLEDDTIFALDKQGNRVVVGKNGRNKLLSIKGGLKMKGVVDPMAYGFVQREKLNVQEIKGLQDFTNKVNQRTNQRLYEALENKRAGNLRPLIQEWLDHISPILIDSPDDSHTALFYYFLIDGVTQELADAGIRDAVVQPLNQTAVQHIFDEYSANPSKGGIAKAYRKMMAKLNTHEHKQDNGVVWVKIPRDPNAGLNSPGVKQLKAIGCKSWCTTRNIDYTQSYVQSRDQYILMINNEAKVGLEIHPGNKLGETTSIINEGVGPIDHYDETVAKLKELGFSQSAIDNDRFLKRAKEYKALGLTDKTYQGQSRKIQRQMTYNRRLEDANVQAIEKSQGSAVEMMRQVEGVTDAQVEEIRVKLLVQRMLEDYSIEELVEFGLPTQLEAWGWHYGYPGADDAVALARIGEWPDEANQQYELEQARQDADPFDRFDNDFERGIDPEDYIPERALIIPKDDIIVRLEKYREVSMAFEDYTNIYGPWDDALNGRFWAKSDPANEERRLGRDMTRGEFAEGVLVRGDRMTRRQQRALVMSEVIRRITQTDSDFKLGKSPSVMQMSRINALSKEYYKEARRREHVLTALKNIMTRYYKKDWKAQRIVNPTITVQEFNRQKNQEMREALEQFERFDPIDDDRFKQTVAWEVDDMNDGHTFRSITKPKKGIKIAKEYKEYRLVFVERFMVEQRPSLRIVVPEYITGEYKPKFVPWYRKPENIRRYQGLAFQAHYAARQAGEDRLRRAREGDTGEWRRAFSKSMQEVEAYYDADTDKLVLVAENIDPKDVVKIILHEITHRGMVQFAKEQGGLNALYNVLSSAEVELMKAAPELLQRTGHESIEELVADYGWDINTIEGKTHLLNELVARWSERFANRPAEKWWKKLIIALKDWVEKYTGVTLTEAGVDEMVSGFVMNGAGQITVDSRGPPADNVVTESFPVFTQEEESQLKVEKVDFDKKKEVVDEIADRLPGTLQRLADTALRMFRERGRQPTQQELADEMGVTVNEMRAVYMNRHTLAKKFRDQELESNPYDQILEGKVKEDQVGDYGFTADDFKDVQIRNNQDSIEIQAVIDLFKDWYEEISGALFQRKIDEVLDGEKEADEEAELQLNNFRRGVQFKRSRAQQFAPPRPGVSIDDKAELLDLYRNHGNFDVFLWPKARKPKESMVEGKIVKAEELLRKVNVYFRYWNIMTMPETGPGTTQGKEGLKDFFAGNKVIYQLTPQNPDRYKMRRRPLHPTIRTKLMPVEIETETGRKMFFLPDVQAFDPNFDISVEPGMTMSAYRQKLNTVKLEINKKIDSVRKSVDTKKDNKIAELNERALDIAKVERELEKHRLFIGKMKAKELSELMEKLTPINKAFVESLLANLKQVEDYAYTYSGDTPIAYTPYTGMAVASPEDIRGITTQLRQANAKKLVQNLPLMASEAEIQGGVTFHIIEPIQVVTQNGVVTMDSGEHSWFLKPNGADFEMEIAPNVRVDIHRDELPKLLRNPMVEFNALDYHVPAPETEHEQWLRETLGSEDQEEGRAAGGNTYFSKKKKGAPKVSEEERKSPMAFVLQAIRMNPLVSNLQELLFTDEQVKKIREKTKPISAPDDQTKEDLYDAAVYRDMVVELSMLEIGPIYREVLKRVQNLMIKRGLTLSQKDLQPVMKKYASLLGFASTNIITNAETTADEDGNMTHDYALSKSSSGRHEDGYHNKVDAVEAYVEIMTDFYDTFDIKQGDPLWRPEGTKDNPNGSSNTPGTLRYGREPLYWEMLKHPNVMDSDILQTVVKFTKGSVQFPLIRNLLKTGVYNNTDIWQGHIEGWEHRAWTPQRKQLENKVGYPQPPTGSLRKPRSVFKTREEFVRMGHLEGWIPVNDFFNDNLDYVTDSLRTIKNAQLMQQLLKRPRPAPLVYTDEKLQEVNLANPSPFAWKAVEYADSDNIINETDRMNKLTGLKLEPQYILEQLDYVAGKKSEGLVKRNGNSFSPPFLYVSINEMLETMFQSSTPGAFGFFMSAFQVTRHVKTGNAVDNIGMWIASSAAQKKWMMVPYMMFRIAPKTVKAIYKGFGIGYQKATGTYHAPVRYESKYPRIKLAQEFGLVAVGGYSSLLRSEWDKSAQQFPEMLGKADHLTDWFFSLGGFGTALFEEMLGDEIYNAFDALTQNFIDNEQLDERAAAKKAVKYMNTSTFMLNRASLGQEGMFLRLFSMSRNFAIGAMRNLYILSQGIGPGKGAALGAFAGVALGNAPIFVTGAILGAGSSLAAKAIGKTRKFRTGKFSHMTNSITAAELTESDMKLLSAQMYKDVAWLAFTKMVVFGALQFGFSYWDDDEIDEHGEIGANEGIWAKKRYIWNNDGQMWHRIRMGGLKNLDGSLLFADALLFKSLREYTDLYSTVLDPVAQVLLEKVATFMDDPKTANDAKAIDIGRGAFAWALGKEGMGRSLREMAQNTEFPNKPVFDRYAIESDQTKNIMRALNKLYNDNMVPIGTEGLVPGSENTFIGTGDAVTDAWIRAYEILGGEVRAGSSFDSTTTAKDFRMMKKKGGSQQFSEDEVTNSLRPLTIEQMKQVPNVNMRALKDKKRRRDYPAATWKRGKRRLMMRAEKAERDK